MLFRSPFSFLTQDKVDADLALKQAKDLMKDQKLHIEQERDAKISMIEMEYALLDAKMLQTELDLKKMALDESLTDKQRASARTLAGTIEGQRGKLSGQQSDAIQLAKDQATSSIVDLLTNIEKLEDAKTDLSDIQVLSVGIAESMSSNFTDAFQSIVSGTASAKQAFATMAINILSQISQMIVQMLVFRALSSFFMPAPIGTPGASAAPHAYTDYSAFARTGGVFSNGKTMQGYATGGIARGSTSGYPAVLHGTEAVVPLPNGRSIPVEMKDSGATNNNIVVNVSTDGQTSTEGSTGPDMNKLGGAIAKAVQFELQNQKRSGGILNPYGVADRKSVV